MKYLCLVYFEQQVLDDLSASEDAALARESIVYDDDLRRNGHYIASAALQPVRSATTVRMRNDKLSMTDGPFAETPSSWAASFTSTPATSTRRCVSPGTSRWRAWAASK